jgi:tetratricopeptide (TPR) repeat protein
MQAVAPLSTPQKPAKRHPMLVPAVTFAVIAVATMVGFRYLPAPDSAGNGALFHQTASGWQRVAGPMGMPEEVRVSATGMVWVLSLAGDGISRLDGTEWRKYSKADFGTQGGHVEAFVVDEDRVWAVLPDEAAVSWDGRVWRSYREAVVSEDPCSIVAGRGRVWVVDFWGNLSEFDGAGWTVGRLQLPGVNWNDDKGPWPKLARTEDGTLWVVRSGVWRFAAGRWTAVAPAGRSLKEAELVGTTSDRVWLEDGETLRSVSADGRTWTEYSVNYSVSAVASGGGHIWLAAGGGILESSGAGWRRLDLPGGPTVIRSIAVGPDGRLWALGMVPGKKSYLWVALALLPLVAWIAALFWMAKRKSQYQRQENERVRQAVEHATGEVPYELQQLQEKQLSAGNPWRAGLILGGTIVLSMVMYSVVRRRWPNEPAWMIVVFAVAIHLTVTFFQSLAKRQPLPSDPIGPGGPSRYDWAKTWKALGAGLVLILLFNSPHLPGYWYVAVILLPLAYQFLGVHLMIKALHRTDYDGALRTVRLFHLLNPQGGVALRKYGIIQLLAGRYREAEDALRGSLAGLKTGPDQAVALDYLGEVLMELGRNEEAQRSFEASLHAAPGFRRPYRGMAEIVLRQGRGPQKALEYVEEIRGGGGISWTGRANRKTEDDYWALKAWALAELGRSAEVAPAIEAAFKATNQKSRTEMATTSYRAGMAMQAIGNQSAANDYFKRAQEFDPHGRRGTLAQAALHAHSVWGG